MPIIKSAKKRVKVAQKATVRNAKTKRSLRRALKAFHTAVTGGAKNTKETHAEAQSALDTAVKKNIMHKNKAARKKKQLAKQAREAAGVTKTAAKKTPAKKTAVKKPAAKTAAKKTTAAKKPATKKAPAKKTTAKKPAAKKTTK